MSFGKVMDGVVKKNFEMLRGVRGVEKLKRGSGG